MTITAMLRSAAIATALVGLVDPVVDRSTPGAGRGRVHSRAVPRPTAMTCANASRAASVNEVTFDSDAEPAAVVVVGGTDATVRSSCVTTCRLDRLHRPAGVPNVRVVAADEPDPVRVGWAATFHAVVEARRAGGQDVPDRPRRARRRARASGAPVDARLRAVRRGAAIYAAGDRHVDGHAARRSARGRVDDDRQCRGPAPRGERQPAEGARARTEAVVERHVRAPRDRSRIRASRCRRSCRHREGSQVRAGSPPAALTADALSAFDAVLIGAPEELRPSEIEALRRSRDGGAGQWCCFPIAGRRAAIWSSSRRRNSTRSSSRMRRVRAAIGSTGACRCARRSSSFTARACPEVRCSRPSTGKGAQDQAARSVVLEWPDGAGRVLFSGAMDAWRFRAAPDDGFGAVLESADRRRPRWPRRRGWRSASRPGVPRPGERRDDSRAHPATEFERGAGPHAHARGPRPTRRRGRRREDHSLVANRRAGRSRGPLRGAGGRPVRSAGQHRDRRDR